MGGVRSSVRPSHFARVFMGKGIRISILLPLSLSSLSPRLLLQLKLVWKDSDGFQLRRRTDGPTDGWMDGWIPTVVPSFAHFSSPPKTRAAEPDAEQKKRMVGRKKRALSQKNRLSNQALSCRRRRFQGHAAVRPHNEENGRRYDELQTCLSDKLHSCCVGFDSSVVVRRLELTLKQPSTMFYVRRMYPCGTYVQR